ncbi:MAG: (Fe-S)-binding protein, partial [Deltaproteobacteria bacterium]|nr:(Fe-S)-binding protein [Deltaproteobacteria bacterium]
YARNKRDQILATGTTIVTTSCQACLAQLRELREHYEMPVKIKSVVELLVESLAD